MWKTFSPLDRDSGERVRAHGLSCFQKLSTLLQNVSSAAVVIGTLRIKYFFVKCMDITLIMPRMQEISAE